MSTGLQKYTVSAGVAFDIPCGGPAGVGAVLLYNFSPYDCIISWSGGSKWLPAGILDSVPVALSATWDGVIHVQPDSEAVSGNGPSSYIIPTLYGPGEPVPEHLPADISRLVNVGNNFVSVSTPANAFEQDFVTGFVLSGYVCTKDVTLANQLDVAAGVAFLRQSDNAWGRVANVATSFLTAVPSTSYFLDLNPDGTWSWGTSHSIVSNHVPIATISTDGSGNVGVITDTRVVNTSLFSTMLGDVQFPNGLWFGQSKAAFNAGAHFANLRDGTGRVQMITPQVAEANFWEFLVWNGLAPKIPFGVGSQAGIAGGVPTWITDAGAFGELAGIVTAGPLGVPAVAAEARTAAITSLGFTTICSVTAPASGGVYRLSAYVRISNGTSGQLAQMNANWTDPALGAFTGQAMLACAGSTTQLANGANTFANGLWVFQSVIVNAKANQLVWVSYNPGSGSPNDQATAVIEQLA